MAKYQEYVEYKDSGVEWLGKVPEHWIVAKTSHFFKIAMGQTILKEDLVDNGRLPVFSATEGNHYLGRINQANVNLDKGDLVIPARGNSIGFVKIVEEPATTTQTTIYCKQLFKEKVISKYVYYYFLGNKKYLFRFTQTAIPQITTEEVGNNILIVPTAFEQQIIINFIDYHVVQIDTLIEKQQTLIKLLKEKRQAVISHAVTKGLNPDAPMKDSEVEWLGDVPEHWEVKRVRHAFDIDNNLRTPINRQSRSEMEGDFRYYGPTGVLNLINRYNVEGQYFLLGEDGDHFLKFEEKPMTIYVKGKFNVNNHAHLIKGKGACSTKWGCLYFEHKDLFPWLIKQGVGRYKLQKTVLLDIPVAIPPLDEQEFILNEVSNKKIYFSEIEKRTETLISLLKERRTALISAAVTGKIDVRGWQAPE